MQTRRLRAGLPSPHGLGEFDARAGGLLAARFGAGGTEGLAGGRTGSQRRADAKRQLPCCPARPGELGSRPGPGGAPGACEAAGLTQQRGEGGRGLDGALEVLLHLQPVQHVRAGRRGPAEQRKQGCWRGALRDAAAALLGEAGGSGRGDQNEPQGRGQPRGTWGGRRDESPPAAPTDLTSLEVSAFCTEASAPQLRSPSLPPRPHPVPARGSRAAPTPPPSRAAGPGGVPAGTQLPGRMG